jgi:hypothetical protein
MHIHVENPLAAHALWTALVGLADRTVESCLSLETSPPPFCTAHVVGSGKDHFLITGVNASFRISRVADIEDNSFVYTAHTSGAVGKVILKAQGWEHRESIDAVAFLSGMLEVVQLLSRPAGAVLRDKIASAEVTTKIKSKARQTFRRQLALLTNETVSFRCFYQQHKSDTDIVQLVESQLVGVEPGFYSYVSMDGTGDPDTIVVKAESGEVALLTIVNDNLLFMTSSKPLGLLMDFIKGVSTPFIDSLVDRTSYVYGILNTVSVE